MTRPYVLLSAAVSVDNYLDDATDERLLLSNAEDFDRVDEVRAGVDAIMIGTGTIRADNPRLLVNSEERRNRRVADGKPAYPLKVTVTTTGDIDPDWKFWHHGGEKVIYCPSTVADRVSKTLGDLASVVAVGESDVSLGAMLDDLGKRGVKRLMVEGGGQIHTQFLTQGLADELHLAIAPIFVGDSRAPRFVRDGAFPNASPNRMQVAEVRQVGDVVLIRYLPSGGQEHTATQ